MHDKKKRDALVMSVYYYCVKQAKRYANYKYDREDALQDALLGAMDAAEKFDETRGIKFITFAQAHILRTLTIGMSAQMSALKIPGEPSSYKYRSAMKDIDIRGIGNAAELHNVKEKGLVSFISATRNMQELSAISETIADSTQNTESATLKHDMTRAIQAALWPLDDRERTYIEEYYYNGLNLRDIAAKYGFCTERVRQVISRALEKIKCKSWHLREFLR